MKIAITGCGHGLCKELSSILSNNYQILSLNKRIQRYTDNIDDIIDDCDVFINCGYSEKYQTQLFTKVFNSWKYKPKTIINILTSALVFGSSNTKYVDDKRDLETVSLNSYHMDKEVRIINMYPNTLENTFNANNQKLKFSEIADIVKWVIQLPQHIEIFQIGISRTKLKIETSII